MHGTALGTKGAGHATQAMGLQQMSSMLLQPRETWHEPRSHTTSRARKATHEDMKYPVLSCKQSTTSIWWRGDVAPSRLFITHFPAPAASAGPPTLCLLSRCASSSSLPSASSSPPAAARLLCCPAQYAFCAAIERAALHTTKANQVSLTLVPARYHGQAID